MAQDQLVEVVTKSLEFRQNIVTLILGVTGFAVAKSWPDRIAHPNRRSLLKMLPCVVLSTFALLVMLYEQRQLLQSVSRDSPADFATHWLNAGEPILDLSIVFSALALLIGVLL